MYLSVYLVLGIQSTFYSYFTLGVFYEINFFGLVAIDKIKRYAKVIFFPFPMTNKSADFTEKKVKYIFKVKFTIKKKHLIF